MTDEATFAWSVIDAELPLPLGMFTGHALNSEIIHMRIFPLLMISGSGSKMILPAFHALGEGPSDHNHVRLVSAILLLETISHARRRFAATPPKTSRDSLLSPASLALMGQGDPQTYLQNSKL